MRKPIALLLVAASLASCQAFKSKPKTPTTGTRVAVLDFETAAKVEPELENVAVVLPPPAVNPDWPQPGGTPAKNGGHLALPDTLKVAWVARVGKGSTGQRRLNAAPVVADGRVFAMDTDGNVAAFAVDGGKRLWSEHIAMRRKAMLAFGGGVSVADGKVYATTGFGIVQAFDAKTGATVWRKDLGLPLRGAATVAGGRVYALSPDNQLFSLKGDTGDTAWSVQGTVEVSGLIGTAAPAVAQDTVVAGYSSGELSALRVENGRTVWSDALARTGRTTALAALTDIDASPVIDRGRVYAIGHGGRMAALELATGQRVWERNFAGINQPWVAGDFIYVVTLDGQLICVTRAEGKIKWLHQLPRYKKPKSKTGAYIWSGPVLASDRLLVAGSNRTLQSVSPYTGKPISAVKLSGAAYLPPIVAGNMVFILTDDGKLTAYR
ncbi:MAG: PQQ-binding-like beta-propeller repeat protein [Sphingomonadaceae bacterium]|nr:PQQ-binding-like beta-propeller repeat protein [Sphingomonadaceae bacterium]